MPPRPRLPPLLTCTCKNSAISPGSNTFSTLSTAPSTSAEPFLDFLYPAFGFFSRSLPLAAAPPPPPAPSTQSSSSFAIPSTSPRTTTRHANRSKWEFTSTGRCPCGRVRLTCLHCRPSSTAAKLADRSELLQPSMSESMQKDTRPELELEENENSILATGSSVNDSLRNDSSSLERLRTLVRELNRQFPPPSVTTKRPHSTHRGANAPLPISRQTAVKSLASFWDSASFLLDTQGAGLSELERLDIIRTPSRIARASLSQLSSHPLSSDAHALAIDRHATNLHALRADASAKMMLLLDILRPARDVKASTEFSALHLDALALTGNLPLIPPRVKPSLDESLAQADLRAIFRYGTPPQMSLATRFTLYQRSRLTFSRLLEAWSTSSKGPEQALEFVAQWQMSHLFEPFTVPKSFKGQVDRGLRKRITALNARHHGDVLRRQYAQILGHLRPSPSAWLQRQPARQSFLGAHLVGYLSLADSPLEGLRIWDDLRNEGVTMPEERLVQTTAALVEGLRRMHLSEDANRVISSVGDLAKKKDLSRALAKNAADQGNLGETLRAIKGVASGDSGSLEVAAVMMRAHAEKNDTRMVRHIFDQTNRTHATPHDQARLWTELVRAYTRVNNVTEAAAALSRMVKEGLTPSIYLVNSLLFAYAARADVERTYELFDHMPRLAPQVHPDAASYAALVAVHCNMLDPEAAERTIQRMSEACLRPNLQIWTTLMNSYVETYQLSKALDIFLSLDKNRDHSLHPDTATVNVLLKAFIRASVPSLVIFAFFRQRVALGFRPNMATYNLVMQSLCATGQTEQAEELFTMLDTASSSSTVLPAPMGPIRPDVFIFSTLIYGYLQRDDFSAARACLDEMTARGIAPTSITYGVIIASFLRGDASVGLRMATDLTNSFLSHIVLQPHSRHRHFDIPLARGQELLHIVGPLVDAYAKRGDSRLAAQYFDLMLDRKQAPSMPLYTAMMNAFCRQDDVDNVWHLWLGIHAAVLNAYPSTKSTEERPHIAQSHRRSLAVPWSIAIDALSQAGWYHVALAQWRMLARQGFGFDVANWNSLGKAACVSGDLETAFWIGEHVLCYEGDAIIPFILPERFFPSGSQGSNLDRNSWSPRMNVVFVRQQARLYNKQDPARVREYAIGKLANVLGDALPVSIDPQETIEKARRFKRRAYWTYSSSFMDELKRATVQVDTEVMDGGELPGAALLAAHPRLGKILKSWHPAESTPKSSTMLARSQTA